MRRIKPEGAKEGCANREEAQERIEHECLQVILTGKWMNYSLSKRTVGVDWSQDG